VDSLEQQLLRQINDTAPANTDSVIALLKGLLKVDDPGDDLRDEIGTLVRKALLEVQGEKPTLALFYAVARAGQKFCWSIWYDAVLDRTVRQARLTEDATLAALIFDDMILPPEEYQSSYGDVGTHRLAGLAVWCAGRHVETDADAAARYSTMARLLGWHGALPVQIEMGPQENAFLDMDARSVLLAFSRLDGNLLPDLENELDDPSTPIELGDLLIEAEELLEDFEWARNTLTGKNLERLEAMNGARKELAALVERALPSD